MDLGLIMETIATDHSFVKESTGIVRLVAPVGSPISIILRLEVRPRFAMQKRADNMQEVPSCKASPSVFFSNRKPLANIHILVVVLEPMRSRRFQHVSIGRCSNSLSSSRISVCSS
jgi:hypothetical protein